MSIQIQHRHAESSAQPFALVTTVRTLADARDEFASWSGPYLSHGDLVRVVEETHETLYVFDSDRTALAEVVAPPRQTPWVAFWEGPRADAYGMLRLCAGVDRRRLVLAACACARTALRDVPMGEDRPRIAIETAERWARGKATWDEVRRAKRAGGAATYSTFAAAAAYHSVDAARADADYDYAARAAVHAANAPAAAAEADALRAMAPLVRRYVPLSVLACALVGAQDPLPIPRDNPRQQKRYGKRDAAPRLR